MRTAGNPPYKIDWPGWAERGRRSDTRDAFETGFTGRTTRFGSCERYTPFGRAWKDQIQICNPLYRTFTDGSPSGALLVGALPDDDEVMIESHRLDIQIEVGRTAIPSELLPIESIRQ